MGLDQLYELTSNVAWKALPILGIILGIFLIIFIRHLIVVLKDTKESMALLKKLLDTSNRQLETLDKPLHTLEEISETVDYVHEASKHAVRSSFVMLLENFSSIKDWIFKYFNKEDDEDVSRDTNQCKHKTKESEEVGEQHE